MIEIQHQEGFLSKEEILDALGETMIYFEKRMESKFQAARVIEIKSGDEPAFNGHQIKIYISEDYQITISKRIEN